MKNFVILVLVLRGIKKNRYKKDENGEILKSIYNAFATSVLLGTAWVFGIIAIGNLRNVFQWLFCIFNSLQGIFIFIFHAARNLEVRKQWMTLFRTQSIGTNSLKSDISETKSVSTFIYLSIYLSHFWQLTLNQRQLLQDIFQELNNVLFGWEFTNLPKKENVDMREKWGVGGGKEGGVNLKN